MSTRELRAFVALAELRNFTRAAERCHLSQPAFSALIRSLEEHIGGRLFDRTTRQVELTVEGAGFLEAAQRLLREADTAVADVRDHVARRRGRVAIAALPSLAAGWLPPLLARYHARYPDIELDVADVLSDDCIARVQTGRADFALASTQASANGLRAERFCADSFHLVCRDDHPLAAQTGHLKLSELSGWPVIQLARSSSVRQHVDAALHPRRLSSFLELEQLSTVAAMVREGLGVSVVPTLTLFHFDHPRLRARPVVAAGLKRQVYLLRRADRALSSAAQGLYELLMAQRPGFRSAA
ncbi:LysR family transcriptional regulator [Hydrogenophaga sp.]|uniref:LysR family transcriptional regulator n=1 Tax=Hydrogenophaga sp. TaxID=1904254 RepID=UPI0025C0C50B|nr:LysR family transcriptional regulator [Hydrogenophaga sp.]